MHEGLAGGPLASSTANAGPDLNVVGPTKVVIDGSASTDPDGRIESYLWSRQQERQ